MYKENKQGYTLIELIVVIVIVAIIAVAVLVAVNPAKRITQAQDSQRWLEVGAILKAVNSYALDYSVPQCTNLDIALPNDDSWRCVGSGIGSNEIDNPAGATIEISYIRPTSADCDGEPQCYNSLSAWELNRKRDLTAISGDNSIEVAQIEGDWSAVLDTTALTISGWTTDANHYIKIYTTSKARHQGVLDESKYVLDISTTNADAITISSNYVKIEGLQIKTSSNLVNNGIKVEIGTIGHEFSYNIIKGQNVNNGNGIYLVDNNSDVKIFNNIIYNYEGTDSTGIRVENQTENVVVYSNTIVDVRGGIYTDVITPGSGVLIAKNNIALNCSSNCYESYFHADSDYNYSGNFSNTGGSNDWCLYEYGIGCQWFQSKSITFIDENNDNFHIASTDIGVKRLGTDLSNDPYFSINNDIDGGLRTLPDNARWDIGADEYGTADCCDFMADIIAKGYLSSVPEDPTESDLEGSGNSGYYIKRGLSGAVWVYAPHKSDYHDENTDIIVSE